MDKTTLFVILACMAGIGINYWLTDSPAPQAPANQPAATAPAQPAATPQQPEAAAAPETPAQPEAAPAPQTDAPQMTIPVATAPAAPKEIATLTGKDKDGKAVARYHFQDIGGSISSVDMVGKAINSTDPALLQDVSINGNAAQGIGTLMFGLSDSRDPHFDKTTYKVIPEESNDKKLTLFGRTENLRILKVYTLKPLEKDGDIIDGNAYVLHLDITIENASGQALAANNWGLYAGGFCELPTESWGSGGYVSYLTEADGDFEKEGISTFSSFFGKDEVRRYDRELPELDWAGLMNQYYATVIKPDKASNAGSIYAAPAQFIQPVTGDKEKGIELGLGIPDFTLNAGSNGLAPGARTLSYDIFTGPKLNVMLNDMTDDFRKIDRLMDYGIFTVISHPMNWLLNVFHGWFGNWGWAIVAMTFVVRLLIWPLYRKSYGSMKRMSLLQPKMKELKEKYPDDQQKVSMEMMKLYREYGISPMGGCLPLLLQMPIFLSFFYVLQTAEEFRGEGFIGWVTDLSQMDTVCSIPIFGWELPINILPVTMVVLMWLQMRMTPQTASDPMQRRIIQLMPLFFFAFCYFYQSALALYWTVTNIISIFQTWLIRRLPEPELKPLEKKKGGKKSFMERMMEAQQRALAEQQRQQQAMRNVTPRKK